MGVDEIKKIITILAKLGNVAGMVFEDGKLTSADVAQIPTLVMIIPLFIEVKWTGLLPEIKDLTLDECNEIVACFKNEFNIPETNIEYTIESIMTIVSGLASLIFDLINVWKKKP